MGDDVVGYYSLAVGEVNRDEAADIAGIRAFAVNAKDETAKRFYEKFDFIPSPADPMHLFVLLKDVRRVIAGK